MAEEEDEIFGLRNADEFDHQIWAHHIGGGEALGSRGDVAPVIMFSGQEWDENQQLNEKVEMWAFIVEDPYALFHYWLHTGEEILKAETWAKIVAVLDE